MKRMFGLCCVLLVALFGCKQEKAAPKLRIGVSIPAATHGWAGGVVWSTEQAQKKYAAEGVEILIATSPDPAAQANAIEDLLVKDVDALVVMAQEPGPITAVCKRAHEQGKYLTVVSNPLSEECQDLFVNGDNGSFGEAAAEAIAKLLDGKGDILVMEGIPCPINTERVTGFQKKLSEVAPGIRILESQSAGWNTQKGLALMESFLLKHPKIDAVWAGDDDVLLGAIKAYRESGRKDVQAFVGGGGSKHVVKMILDNDPLVKATVTYPPQMIATAIDATVQILRKTPVTLDAATDFSPTKEGQPVLIIKSKIVDAATAKEHYYPESVY
ncbi:MAG: substrate-binding domain-containing protein [Victivallales bacterium]|nr:substrate-binding domain-containing protein [Victivallales bacterium]